MRVSLRETMGEIVRKYVFVYCTKGVYHGIIGFVRKHRVLDDHTDASYNINRHVFRAQMPVWKIKTTLFAPDNVILIANGPPATFSIILGRSYIIRSKYMYIKENVSTD